MGKYGGVVIGAVVAALGALGLMSWWIDFMSLVRGSVPVMMIFGGVIAVIAGLSEMKDEAASKKEEKKQ
jgi:succinate-acetate transporter protein